MAAEKTGRKGLYIATDAANTERGCRIGLQVRPIPQAPPVYWLLTFLKNKETTKMKIFLLMIPPTVTAQERKVKIVHGRPFFYKPENVKIAQAEIIRHLRPFKPKEPMEGAIELKVSWRFPKGKSHKANEWRITKPDTDNLEKMLKDCMTEVGFWKDDAQVVRETAEKSWVYEDECGILIEVNQLGKFTEEVINNG